MPAGDKLVLIVERALGEVEPEAEENEELLGEDDDDGDCVPVALGVGERVPLDDTDVDKVPLGDRLPLGEELMLGSLEPEGESVEVLQPEADSEGDGAPLAVSESAPVDKGEGESGALTLEVALTLDVGQTNGEVEPDSVVEKVCQEDVADGDCNPVGDCREGEADGDGVRLATGVSELVARDEADGDEMLLKEELLVAWGLALDKDELEGGAERENRGEGDEDGDRVPDTDGHEGDADGDGVSLTAGVSVPVSLGEEDRVELLRGLRLLLAVKSLLGVLVPDSAEELESSREGEVDCECVPLTVDVSWPELLADADCDALPLKDRAPL